MSSRRLVEAQNRVLINNRTLSCLLYRLISIRSGIFYLRYEISVNIRGVDDPTERLGSPHLSEESRSSIAHVVTSSPTAIRSPTLGHDFYRTDCMVFLMGTVWVSEHLPRPTLRTPYDCQGLATWQHQDTSQTQSR